MAILAKGWVVVELFAESAARWVRISVRCWGSGFGGIWGNEHAGFGLGRWLAGQQVGQFRIRSRCATTRLQIRRPTPGLRDYLMPVGMATRGGAAVERCCVDPGAFAENRNISWQGTAGFIN